MMVSTVAMSRQGFLEAYTYNQDITKSVLYDQKTGAMVAIYELGPDDVADHCVAGPTDFNYPRLARCP